MHRCLIYFVVFLLYAQSLWAVSTETHTYIVDYKEDRIVVIDRKTGQESVIKCQSPMTMFVHGNKGYVGRAIVGYWEVLDLSSHQFVARTLVVGCKEKMLFQGTKGYAYSQHNDFIDVIDLEQNVLAKTIKVGPISTFEIHEGAGYVFHLGSTVKKICLTDDKVVQVFPLDTHQGSTALKLYRDRGYLINALSDSLTVFDLVEFMYWGKIPVGKTPMTMEIRGGFGYVPNKDSHTLTVVDLTGNVESCTLSIGPCPSSVSFYQDKGFVLHEKSSQMYIFDLQSNTALAVLDLTYFWKLEELDEPIEIAPMVMVGNFGVVQHTRTKFTIVQLDTFEVVDILSIPRDTELFLSDTHFYAGGKKLIPRPDYCCLFREPYAGIEGYHFEKDAEEAFINFEQEVTRKNYKRAKEFFDFAIALSHSKAFSVAFFAFFHGKFGAFYNINWAKEFIPGMDLTYYESLCEIHGFPIHCTCLPRLKLEVSSNERAQ